MRKLLSVLLSIALAISLVGCGTAEDATKQTTEERQPIKRPEQETTNMLIVPTEEGKETTAEQETTTEVPTEPATEAPTPAPTEPPTQKPTEPPTPAPTQPPTEPPTEKPTPAPTQPPTQPPTEPPTEAKLTDVAPTKTHTFSGSGDDVITGVKIENISFVRYSTNGDGYNSLKAYHDDKYDLLVSEIGSYTGNTLLLPYDSEVMIEISTDGEWVLEIYTIGVCSADSFSGSSDYVTGIFESTSDVYQVDFTGDGYFSIKAYYENKYGRFTYDLLVSEIDSYSGKTVLKQKGNYVFFEIEGIGNWSITPVK